MISPLRIGHFQCESRLDAFDANVANVLDGLGRAEADGVQIVSFPECMLTGYSDQEARTRKVAITLDGAEVRHVLDKTRRFDQTIIVGLSERDGADLYITSIVARRGELLGHYRKCSAYEPFNKQGREFPVFEHDGVPFGVIICSDGGYIEPARILALKGARIIFAPHYNYIRPEHLIGHFMRVRADHAARAIENGVYLLRGNSVTIAADTGFTFDGVGYGDSYLIDPDGEIMARTRRHAVDFLFKDVELTDRPPGEVNKSLWSARTFGPALLELAGTVAKSSAAVG